MRTLLLAALLACAASVFGQKTIYAYAVGNWRNGPVVYLTPIYSTTEAFTDEQLLQSWKGEHSELEGVKDFDVLRFATSEEAHADRSTLQAKYLQRNLEVRMMEPPTLREAEPEEP